MQVSRAFAYIPPTFLLLTKAPFVICSARVKLQDLPGATRAKRSRTAVAEGSSARASRPLQAIRDLTSEEIQESERKRQDAKRRRAKKRLEELERTNFRDTRSEINLGGGGDAERALLGEKASAAAQLAGLLAAARGGNSDEEDAQTAGPSSSRKSSQKQSAKLRSILSGKKNLQSLIDDLRSDQELRDKPNYLTATAPPSAYPTRHLCSVDGYWGDITCSKCGDRVCGLACVETYVLGFFHCLRDSN